MGELIVPALLSGSFKTNTYVYLFKTAKLALSEAEKNEEGRIYNLMTTFVFLAFSFEAYLNHIGSKSIDNWDKNERSWGQRKRRAKVFQRFGIVPDYNEPPFSEIEELFTFRDKLAHGKTEVIVETRKEVRVNWSNVDLDQALTPSWLRECTIESANNKAVAIEKIINLLGEKAHERSPLRSLGSGSYNLQRLDI